MSKNKGRHALKESNDFRDQKSPVDVPIYKGKKGKEAIEVNKKILILCEGETEENYFKGIVESETVKSAAVYTAIVKNPKRNQAQNLIKLAALILAETSEKKYPGLSEYLNEVKNEKNGEPYKTYYGPVCDKILDDSGSDRSNPFDQIWLVFDNDDNSGTIPAAITDLFAKAKAFGIETAYSNRQWEQWVLLHFELNQTAFLASECKNKIQTAQEVKDYHNGCRCGLNASTNKDCIGTDCKGQTCVGGYLREKKYHPSYKKGDWREKKGEEEKEKEKEKKKTPLREYCFEGLFAANVVNLSDPKMQDEKTVFDKIKTAIANAKKLRDLTSQHDSATAKNPYTDVDRLVEVLLNNRKGGQ